MAEKTILLAIGILATKFTGLFCECFLKASVKAKPKSIHLQQTQAGGGGKQLGVMERLIFFAALWRPEYAAVAGAWLVFKAAGKWAAWQHIAQIPKEPADVEDRIVASSRLLGRWLNGTLYNGLCAAC